MIVLPGCVSVGRGSLDGDSFGKPIRGSVGTCCFGNPVGGVLRITRISLARTRAIHVRGLQGLHVRGQVCKGLPLGCQGVCVR
eukprot:2276698-Prorocentrum_lima.AAC.1